MAHDQILRRMRLGNHNQHKEATMPNSDISEDKKILDVVSNPKQKRFHIEKPYLRDVTIEDLNNLALALKDLSHTRGYPAGQACCCCQFCCSCATAIVPKSN